MFLEDNYEDLEFWYPCLRFQEEGAEVTVVAPELKSYTSKHEYPAQADLKVDEANPQDFDAVIVPGGYAPDKMRRYPEMINFLKNLFGQGKVVAAICHGPWMLVSAGVLQGRKATCFYAIKDDIINAGAEYLEQPVVRDGRIITSRIPSDLPLFCREIITALLEN